MQKKYESRTIEFLRSASDVTRFFLRLTSNHPTFTGTTHTFHLGGEFRVQLMCLKALCQFFYGANFCFLLQFSNRIGVLKLHRLFHFTRVTDYLPPAELNHGGK